MRKYLGLVLVGVIAFAGVACSSEDEGGGMGGTGGTGGSGGSGGSGGEDDLCANAGGSGEVTLPAELTQDTFLSADCSYLITQLTYVVSGTTRIEAGTELFGNPNPGEPSGFIVTQNGKVDAVGTAADPIVFTSGLPEGERNPGDWGGVALLGKARLSFGGSACDGEAGLCTDNLEGLEATEDRGLYGGPDDTHDCGTLKYVRIEFAGFELTQDNELNSLSVAGCGDQTELSYIQTHRGEDDGIEFFGGTAQLDHAIVSGTGDDGIDWDQGFRGTITNFIVDHFAPRSSDPRGMETDNNGGDFDSEPRSAPVVSYGTLIGSAGTDSGIVNREGTWGIQDGLVVVGFDKAGYDMRDAAWQNSGWPNEIAITNSCFSGNSPNFPPQGTNCEDPVPANRVGDCNDPFVTPAAQTFDESAELIVPALGNLEEDPDLGDTSGSANGGTPDYSVGNPNCMGAFAPSGNDWTTGDWTAFPEN
jgi:hypothetical protein